MRVDLDEYPFGPTGDVNILVHPTPHARRGGGIVGGERCVLNAQGYANWQRLILRPASAASQTTTAYKSSMRAQIVKKGFKLVLNVGDQWSDLKGTPEAELSVKYPDPYYLIP